MRRILRWLKRQLRFRRDFRNFTKSAEASGRELRASWDDRFPCLEDRDSGSDFDRHYVYHPAWAARAIARSAPARHVDCSSLLQFTAIISTYVPVDLCVFQPLRLSLPNVRQIAADLTALPFPSNSIPSLSCMHVVEHIGLGRYGDAIDAGGDLKAMRELQRVLAPGGELLFVVPVGRPRVQFNAHRVYSADQIAGWFPELRLEELSLIPEKAADGAIVSSPSAELLAKQSYGCGCFRFRKPGAA